MFLFSLWGERRIIYILITACPGYFMRETFKIETENFEQEYKSYFYW